MPTQPPPSSIDWASWVQAAVTAVGLGIAIYVPWKQTSNRRADERRRDKIEGQNIAIAIFPAIIELAARVNALVVDVKACAAAPALFGSGKIPLDLPIPAILLEFRARFYLLGEPGKELQQALAVAIHHATMIKGLQDGLPYHQGTGTLGQRLGEWVPFLERTEEQLNHSKMALQPLHDMIIA